jgi:hypothetical protein
MDEAQGDLVVSINWRLSPVIVSEAIDDTLLQLSVDELGALTPALDDSQKVFDRADFVFVATNCGADVKRSVFALIKNCRFPEQEECDLNVLCVQPNGGALVAHMSLLGNSRSENRCFCSAIEKCCLANREKQYFQKIYVHP